jgi:hypothetical protein
MFGMMGRVSIEHLFRQVQGQHKALAREGSFVWILHGSIDSFIEGSRRWESMDGCTIFGMYGRIGWWFDRGACVGLAFLPWNEVDDR